MIEMIYKATCDHCENRGPYDSPSKELSQKDETILRNFMKRLGKIGWRRIEGKWACPSCVRSVPAQAPPKVRNRPLETACKPRKLSKAAHEALATRMIDDD